MNRRVTVTTGARLHFGPLAVGAAQGRTFGGVGLMMDAPGWEIVVERAERDEISARMESDRIAEILGHYRQLSPVAAPSCRVTVEQRTPAHAGLGSGTQLALAMGRGLSALSNEAVLDVAELARRTNRGRRSAIGTHGFATGGFLVDAGRPVAGGLGELACRVEMPAGWRFLLATPVSRSGLSGSAEQHAFESLPPMPLETTATLCRIVVTEWLPAVQAGDIGGFSAALDAFGGLVGEYFRPVQRGVFADTRMAKLAGALQSAGIRGVAQSSWGPTIAVCCANEDAAVRLQGDLVASGDWRDCELRMTRPLNTGARVVVED